MSALPRGASTKGGDRSDFDRKHDVDDSDDDANDDGPDDPPTSSLIQTTTGTGTQSIGGLATGLDTNAIIAALVASERALENPIKNQGSLAQLALQSYGLIRTNLTALSTAALALARPAAWNTLAATSSNADVASVTAGNGTFSGTLSFTVDALASAGSVRSTNIITDTTTTIAAHKSVFVAAGGQALGFSTFASDDTLADRVRTRSPSRRRRARRPRAATRRWPARPSSTARTTRSS